MSGKGHSAPRRRARASARLHAVQALFEMEATGQSVDRVLEGIAHRQRAQEAVEGVELAAPDEDLLRAILEAAVRWQARIDQMTDRALVARWPIDRIDPTLRALFRAAGAELVEDLAPPQVVISEYVDLAKAFFPDLSTADGRPRRAREPGFVNAVLDHMAREARPEAFAN